MHALIALLVVWGTAPICAFDGYTAECFYFSYAACELAIQDTGNQQCIPNPDRR